MTTTCQQWLRYDEACLYQGNIVGKNDNLGFPFINDIIVTQLHIVVEDTLVLELLKTICAGG